ncbi:MAG: stage IV sporulation protein A [Bacilli bacterium]|nr:stage IV sporulation protein A [Bacilli bacterium]
MDKTQVIESIAKRGNGEIYLGVVGAVRTGKSTFIKRFIENLVVPNIKDEYEKKHCLDEIPQSAQGKTIMTTEPKFVPSNGATIEVNEFTTDIKLIDCVGYVIPGANGYEDEMGNPRMVKTPWTPEEIPFIEAAEIGTEKVIRDHATIGIVVTTDGSFGEIPRNEYLNAEERVISELKGLGKPFIVIMNTVHPTNTETVRLSSEMSEKYDVPVMPISIETMNEKDIMEILKTALMEFPVLDVNVSIPEWIHVLDNKHAIKEEFLTKIKESVTSVDKLKDIDDILGHFQDCNYIDKSYISSLDASLGVVTIKLEATNDLYRETLKSVMGDISLNKAGILKMFVEWSSGASETLQIKEALKMAKSAGYGIMYPELKDMRLETPEIIKQGSRYGVKLKAVASSIHLIKVDVESTFEPIIGSEQQSKELINYLMKDYETDPTSIWKSEIFGRSLDTIVKEGIQGKLSLMPDATRFKLSSTITKIVNKGSNNLIAFVL